MKCTRATLIALVSTSLLAGASLVHCSGSSSGDPDDHPDGSVPLEDGGSTDGGVHQPCTPACGGDQVCSNGTCVELPDHCPCPKGSYCDLAINACVRGCIGRPDCSNGEYCEESERACKAGCARDEHCTAPQVCGANGVPNVCGCVGTCGDTCGFVVNGCGQRLECGACCAEAVCRFEWKTVTAPQSIYSFTRDPGGDLYAVQLTGTAPHLEFVVHAYTLATKTWKVTPLSSKTRHSPQIAYLNNQLYVIGGYDSTSQEKLKSVFAYDFRAGVQRNVGEMMYARANHSATSTPDGTLVVAGGAGTVVEALRAGSSRFESLGQLPQAVSSPGVTVASDGAIYVTGGLSGGNSPTHRVHKWTQSGGLAAVGNLRLPRGRHATVAGPGGRLFVFGGDASERAVEVFPGGGELPPLPEATTVIGAVLASDGHFYVATSAGKMFTTAP